LAIYRGLKTSLSRLLRTTLHRGAEGEMQLRTQPTRQGLQACSLQIQFLCRGTEVSARFRRGMFVQAGLVKRSDAGLDQYGFLL
jgi:hypothetical protein